MATGFFAAHPALRVRATASARCGRGGLGQNVADPVSMKINKTSSGISAQNSWQATEQIHTARKFQSEPASIPDQMYTEDDQDQYDDDDDEQDLPMSMVRILSA